MDVYLAFKCLKIGSNIINLIFQEVLSILFELFDKDNEKVLKQEQWIQSLKERLL